MQPDQLPNVTGQAYRPVSSPVSMTPSGVPVSNNAYGAPSIAQAYGPPTMQATNPNLPQAGQPQPHANPNSTQNSLQIAEIRDGIVIMQDGSYRSVVMVKSINFDFQNKFDGLISETDFPKLSPT